MKQNRFYLATILLFLIGYGCTKNKSDNIKQFDKFQIEQKVETQQVHLPSTNFMDYPAKVIQNDSILYLLDIGKSTDYFVHCYSLPNYQYLQSIFKRGQGPNEYISINNIQALNDTLYAYGAANEIFSTSIKNDELNSPIKKIEISDEFGSLVRGFKTKSRFYFPVFNKTSDNRMLEFDSKGSFVSSFGHLISKENDTKASATHQAYMPFIHGNENYLVTATQFGEIIEIYDLSNKTQTNLVGKKAYPKFQEVKNMAINAGIMGFEDIFTTTNYIYALFNGENVNERDINRQGGKYIYVFNFDGKPIMKLILNRYATSLFVDDNDNTMYLLDVNTDEPLFTLALNDVLE